VGDRIAEIVILVEDERHANFIRRHLGREYDPRKFRVNKSPLGRGSGEQYVREQYPLEVKEYRSRASRRSAALVVVTDADAGTVGARAAQLTQILHNRGERERGNDEAIALLIPRRHIETWILCLIGEIVNETTDYKHRDGLDRRIREAASALYEWSRNNYTLPEHCVASLRQAIPELKRIAHQE